MGVRTTNQPSTVKSAAAKPIGVTPISPLRRRMIDDMTLRNLSPTTPRSCLHAVAAYGRYFGRSPDRLGLKDVRAYQVHLAGKRVAWATLNQIGCALRLDIRRSPTIVALWAKFVMGSWRRLDRLRAPIAADPTHHYDARLRSAISLSDGWNAPRRRCGGTIDAKASSFSVGSPRV
jgi:Phage integrase, N-terminal SAM-like domain